MKMRKTVQASLACMFLVLAAAFLHGAENPGQKPGLADNPAEGAGLSQAEWIQIRQYLPLDSTSEKAFAVDERRLVADDADNENSFGVSVSVAGDWLVVGAPWDEVNGQSKAGSAYVFRRSGGVWTAFDKLTADPVAADDNFGFSVAVALEGAVNPGYAYVVVGAPRRHVDTGIAHAFVFDCDVSAACELSATLAGNHAGDKFGYSVATNGTSVAVGRPDEDHAGGSSAGSVHYLDLSVPGPGSPQIVAYDAAPDDMFGTSVSVSGSKLFVGSPGADHFAGQNAGAVYTYQCMAGICDFVQKLYGSDTGTDSNFGWSVATSHDLAVVGAPGVVTGVVDAGAAYVFERDEGDPYWVQQQKLLPDEVGSSDQFGDAVSLNVWPGQQRIAVGAPFTDQAGPGTGTAFVFTRLGAGGDWMQTHTFAAPTPASGDVFGVSTGMYGDTVVVGMPGDDYGLLEDAGSIFVYTLALFSCDFETGNMSGWSSVAP